MKVSDIILTEYADRRFNGLGSGLESISTGNLPCVVPSMYLLLRFQATGQDAGVNRLEIRLVKDDGTFRKAEGSMTVSDDGEDDPYISMPLHFRNTRFETEGKYDFQVYINGRLDAQRPFQIKRHTPQPS
jgi:hypothetical protein